MTRQRVQYDRVKFVRDYMEAYKAGLTQAEFARLLGISRDTLRTRLQSVRGTCRRVGVEIPRLRRERNDSAILAEISLAGIVTSELAAKKRFKQ